MFLAFAFGRALVGCDIESVPRPGETAAPIGGRKLPEEEGGWLKMQSQGQEHPWPWDGVQSGVEKLWFAFPPFILSFSSSLCTSARDLTRAATSPTDPCRICAAALDAMGIQRDLRC